MVPPRMNVSPRENVALPSDGSTSFCTYVAASRATSIVNVLSSPFAHVLAAARPMAKSAARTNITIAETSFLFMPKAGLQGTRHPRLLLLLPGLLSSKMNADSLCDWAYFYLLSCSFSFYDICLLCSDDRSPFTL